MADSRVRGSDLVVEPDNSRCLLLGKLCCADQKGYSWLVQVETYRDVWLGLERMTMLKGIPTAISP